MEEDGEEEDENAEDIDCSGDQSNPIWGDVPRRQLRRRQTNWSSIEDDENTVVIGDTVEILYSTIGFDYGWCTHSTIMTNSNETMAIYSSDMICASDSRNVDDGGGGGDGSADWSAPAGAVDVAVVCIDSNTNWHTSPNCIQQYLCTD